RPLESVPVEGRNVPFARRAVNQYREALKSRLLFLGADHPVGGRSLVPRRLGSEEFPCIRIRAKLLLQIGMEFRRLSLLLGVNRRAVAVTLLESRAPCRMHQPQLCQFLRTLDVDCAPDTSWLAWSETDFVAVRVDAFANPIDPAEAERSID